VSPLSLLKRARHPDFDINGCHRHNASRRENDMSTEPDTTATLDTLLREISVHSGTIITLHESSEELLSA
jgi:hypothetical protein